MKLFFQSFLIVWMALFAREGVATSEPGSVTVRFEIPVEHARAWTAQKKGNITLYSVKPNTNQFTKATKPFVEGHINEIQMAGLESAKFGLPEEGKYRLKWNVDGRAKWTQEFDYDGLESPELFTILYNGEGVSVATYEAKNKGTETLKRGTTAAHGEHQDLKLRSMADLRAKAEEEEKARQVAVAEEKRRDDERKATEVEEARRKEREIIAKKNGAATTIQTAVRGKQARDTAEKMRDDKRKAELEAAATKIQSKARQRAATQKVSQMRTEKAAAEMVRREAEAQLVAEEARKRAVEARVAEERIRKEEAGAKAIQEAEEARKRADEEAREAAHVAAIAAAAAGREVNPRAVPVTVRIEDRTGDNRLAGLLRGGHLSFSFREYTASGAVGAEILNQTISLTAMEFSGPDASCQLSLNIQGGSMILGVYAPGIPLQYIAEPLEGGEFYLIPA